MILEALTLSRWQKTLKLREFIASKRCCGEKSKGVTLHTIKVSGT